MPQFQEQKKGMVRVKILSKDSLRAYYLLMQKTGGKIQALPGDIYVLKEDQLEILTDNNIGYDTIADK